MSYLNLTWYNILTIMRMYENHIEPQQNSSVWTQTQRNQVIQVQKSPQIPIKEQKETIILKYPYLRQRSSQKIKQDNLSNKSTQKQKRGHRERKKIFQAKSTIKSEMKNSTLSADRNRKLNYNGFQNNPISNKLRNSKNKSTSMKKSQQSSFNCQYNILNSNSISPVTFHYSNPQQVTPSSVCVSRLQHFGSIPAPLNIPYSIPPPQFPIQYQRPPNQQIYYGASGLYNQPTAFKHNPPVTFVPQYHPLPPQIHINRYQSVPQNHVNLINTFSSQNPYKSSIIGNQNQSPLRFKQISQSIHLTPIVQQNTPNQNSPQLLNPQTLTFQQKSKQNYQKSPLNNNIQINKQKVKEQKKSMFREYPEVESQQSFMPNTYQTYKLSQKSIKKENKFKQESQTKKITHFQTKRASPIKRKASSKEKIKQKIRSRASLQSFQYIKQCQSQPDTDRDIEELDGIYEEAKYSDRFFDMDLKHHTLNLNLEGDMETKNNIINKNTSTSIEFNMLKFNEQKEKYSKKDFEIEQTPNANTNKQKTLFKKPSITSIALERQKQKLKLINESNSKIYFNSNEKHLNRPISFDSNSAQKFSNQQKGEGNAWISNILSKLNKQVPITVIFIGLGLLLVFLQIIK